LGWHFHTSLGGKWGGVIVTKFCARVHVDYVLILVNFGFDISRDVDFVGVKIQGFQSTSFFGLTTAGDMPYFNNMKDESF
jgi:hypothetical protein